MARILKIPMKLFFRPGLFPLYCCAFAVLVAVLFFAVDLRYGFPHFDSYQYSASVGPQATGLRPRLVWVEGIEEFKNGAELTLPGLYWAKRIVFSVVPYGFSTDQALSFVLLVLSSWLALLLLRQAGWGRLAAFLMFGLMLTAPTFLVNATGTRPEPLAVLLLFGGMILLQKQGSIRWAIGGGLVLGLAGVVHVYAALLGPMLAVAVWLNAGRCEQRSDWRRLSWIALGLGLGWLLLPVFWMLCPDAWRLFRINLVVQRGFHQNSGRFLAYLQSFRLGAGLWVASLLVLAPMISWIHWFCVDRSPRSLLVPVVVSACCLVIPASFWVLKTEQYFYGDLVWPALVAALMLFCRDADKSRSWVVILLALGLSGGVARLAARAQLGIRLHGVKAAREQRLEWLKERVYGAPRLYVFTTEWDIAAAAGVADVRFYAFPLPITPDIVGRFEAQTFDSTPNGALMLFDREYADNCPYANPSAFDPTGSQEWEMLETRTWRYDLSPSKPAARIWELWRKKARP